MKNLDLLDGNTLVLDNSSLECLKTCPTMFYYKHIAKRVRTGPAAARDAGKALHVALETRYRCAGSEAPSEMVQQAMQAVLAAGFNGVDLPLEEYRTLDRYSQVLAAYNAQWKREPFEVLGVEIPFAIPLGEVWFRDMGSIAVIWQGRIDALIRNPGGVFVMDHKTMNGWSNYKLTEWENASGPKGYGWAVQELATRHPELGLPERVHGFLLNAIVVRKPSDSIRVKLPREEFHRFPFHYSQEAYAEWRLNTLQWVKVALDFAAAGRWPMNERVCGSFYGQPCPYLDVCMSPPDQRELVLSTDLYEDYTWSPLGESGPSRDALERGSNVESAQTK